MLLWCLFYPLDDCCHTVISPVGPHTKDEDSDEEWPALGEAGAGEGDDAGCATEVVVDAEDEKAIETFMNKNPPMR